MKKYLICLFAFIALACFSLELPVPGAVTPTATEATSVTASPTPDTHCTVNTSALNLRACAGTQCTAQGWLKEGEVLTILDQQDQWLKVETQSGDTGWVHSKFCSGE